jgi:shikimate kinase
VPRTDKLYLVGFMGAGKSTVARAIAARIGWKVLDVDEWIERREQKAVADIFRLDGEPYFRAIEREAVRSMLPERYAVVATGGGTFADPDTRAAILADGTTVWLDVPLSTIVARVPSDGRRPLAADRAAFEALYVARAASYRYAHIRLEGGEGSADALVERLLDRLGW